MTEIKRKANAGERIKIVNAGYTFGDYANGTEMVVKHREGDRCVCVEDYGVHNGVQLIADYEYVVLEPDAPIIVLPDESLGGVLHEYREVKRKASVGETIRVFGHCDQRANGVFTVDSVIDCRDGYGDTYYYTVDGGSRYGTPYYNGKAYVVLEPTEILRIDDKDGVNRAYRMVDRKAAVGDYVLITQGNGWLQKGALIPLNERAYYASKMTINFVDGTYGTYGARHRVLELLSSAELAPTPTPLSTLPLPDQYAENITVLTRKIAQLETELRVAREDIVLIEEGVSGEIKALEKRILTLEERILALETDSSPAYVKVAEGPVDNALPTFSKADAYADLAAKMFATPPVKSAQQIRDEIVERAKADVSDLRKFRGKKIPNDSVSFWPKTELPHAYIAMHTVEFVVNSAKRTVAVIIRCTEDGLTTRGIAKCAPGETFNAHIGRAIALYRALGLEIPAEYLTCPQPEEVRVGDVVHYVGGGRIAIVADDHDDIDVATHTFLGTAVSCRGKIIDDSRTGVAEAGGDSAASSALKGAA